MTIPPQFLKGKKKKKKFGDKNSKGNPFAAAAKAKLDAGDSKKGFVPGKKGVNPFA